MKKLQLIVMILASFSVFTGYSQVSTVTDVRILFQGVVMDAATLSPLPNSQIYINRSYNSSSDKDGSFAFLVNRKDTVLFTLLGYKSTQFYISDTLSGREFNVGVYLNTDTLSIGEVIIVPRLDNLKYDLLNTPPVTSPEMENAKYNMEIASYQARIGQGKLGDPSSNYELLRQKQRTDAYEKGGVPSSRMIGLSPFTIIPIAYMLLKGLPQKPAPMKSHLTQQEISRINKKYLESHNMTP